MTSHANTLCTDLKHLLRTFSGILALILTLALLAGCDDEQDASLNKNISAKENLCEKGIAALEKII